MAVFPYSIVFIRHGETSYNAEGRLQGQRDIAAERQGPRTGERGRAFAEEADAGRDRAARSGRGVRRLAADSAPARRWNSLAPRWGWRRGDIGCDPTLVELSFGDWEGLTWPEIEARDPAGLRAREADKWNFVPPNGESYAMLCDRLRPWVAARNGDAFVASHGGVARALMTLIAGVSPGIATEISIWQGRAILFENGGYRWVG